MKETLLLLLAILLAAILFPIGFAWGLIKKKERNKYLFTIAIGIDQLGNVVCQNLFNAALIKSHGYRFGREDETISSVIGKNHRDGTLTDAGKVLRILLDRIEKEHTKKWIKEFPTS